MTQEDGPLGQCHSATAMQSSGPEGASCQWHPKMARWASATARTSHQAQAQEHPPAATGQPLPLWEQHQDFFGILHPACQFANPSAQLYGSAGLAGTTGWTGGKTGIG